MDQKKSTAVSIEVGMQNSGLGASLAAVHFSPWHIISGPIIATIFRKQQEKDDIKDKNERISA